MVCLKVGVEHSLFVFGIIDISYHTDVNSVCEYVILLGERKVIIFSPMFGRLELYREYALHLR